MEGDIEPISMADAEILQNEIEGVQEAILSVDKRVDALEEEHGPGTGEPEAESASVPVEPVIDLAQTVGRLEAEVSECRLQIAELQSKLSMAEASMAAALAVATSEPEESEEVTVAEVEVPETPEEESESEGHSRERSTRSEGNWLERLLLVR